MIWNDYTTRSEQADQLAAQVAEQLNNALLLNNKASLAVPGGTTPGAFLEALAKQAIDWTKVTVTLTDERQVPSDDARSNARLLKEHLLDLANNIQFIPLYHLAEGDKGNDFLALPTQQLNQRALPLDVCVVGMGNDGHTASLFPLATQLSAALDLNGTQPLMAMEAENIPEPRITLTLPYLLSASALHVLICGEEKKQTWQVVANQADDIAAMPVRGLIVHAADKLAIHYAE